MANRFWVGGTGTWDVSSTTHWSASTGGASGASAPTTADTANIDALSGSGTITTASGATAGSIVITSSALNLSLGAGLICTGQLNFTTCNVTLNSFTLTGTILSLSSATSRTISFGTGKIVLTGNNTNSVVVTNCTGLTVSGTRLVECNYAGGTGTRVIAMGSSGSGSVEGNSLDISVTAGTDIVDVTTNRQMRSLNMTGFSGTLNLNANFYYGDFTLSSGLTLGTSTAITFLATSGTRTITTSGKTLDFPITFNGTGGTFQFQDALTQGSTRAFTLTNGTVQLKNGVTATVGVFTTSGTTAKFLQSSTPGSFATLSQASGTANMTYLTIKDVHATGGASWNALTQAFTQGGNTGIYFPATLGKPIPSFAF